MSKDELPAIPEILRKNIVIKRIPEGIKMTYVRNKFARRIFVFSILLALYLGHLFVVATTYEGEERQYLGTVLLILFTAFCLCFALYPFLYRCSIIFHERYIQVTNLTFYPRIQRIRRFSSYYLEMIEFVKSVVGSHNGYRNENHYPMVYLKSKYNLIEIHHSDIAYAESHKEVMSKCLKLTEK